MAVEHGIVGGHKRIFLNFAFKFLIVENHHRHFYLAVCGGIVFETIAKRAVIDARIVDFFNIDVGYCHLFAHIEAGTFLYHIAQLGYDGIAGKHKVGGRFAISARSIHIGGYIARRLLGDERHESVVLASKFVGCREVYKNICAIDGLHRTRWHRSPQVFAYLASYLGIAHCEEQVAPEGHFLAIDVDSGVFAKVIRRCKPTFFVKLVIIGDICFGHHTHNLAIEYCHGTIEHSALKHYGQTHHHEGIEPQGG